MTLTVDQAYSDAPFPTVRSTRDCIDVDYDSGLFGGKGKKSRLWLNVHNMQSDGYQTYNYQDRDGVLGEVSVPAVATTRSLTAFTSVMHLTATRRTRRARRARRLRSSATTS